MNAMIEARDVSYAIAGDAIIDGITLLANPGELVAVVGPNGAGKSTLLRLLAGDVVADRGDVRVGGANLRSLSLGDLALERSYLTQQPTQQLPFTATEVVAMGRYPYRTHPDVGAEDDAAAVAWASAAMEVDELDDRTVSTLSGGEAQRVHVARVLAQQAPITLLDEPTAGLDIAHQHQVMRTLREVVATGVSVIAVLHDLNLAARYADRIVLLSSGRVVAEGRSHDVLVDDVLSDVYDHPIRVVDHPLGGTPLVLPVDHDSDTQA